jgi:hypothetical protein
MKLGKLLSRATITPYLVAWTVLALGRSWRLKIRGWEKVRELEAKGQAPIFAFWHGRLLPLGYAFRKRRYAIMSSESRDGQISIKANTFLGFEVIGGSSTHGGTKGLREITRVARTGRIIGITPDGPKGPRQKLQEGVLMIAMATGRPLVPITATARRAVQLHSWDRFLVPLPFTEVVVTVGEPMFFPRKMSKEEREDARIKFEAQMNALLEETDGIFGRPSVP